MANSSKISLFDPFTVVILPIAIFLDIIIIILNVIEWLTTSGTDIIPYLTWIPEILGSIIISGALIFNAFVRAEVEEAEEKEALEAQSREIAKTELESEQVVVTEETETETKEKEKEKGIVRKAEQAASLEKLATTKIGKKITGKIKAAAVSKGFQKVIIKAIAVPIIDLVPYLGFIPWWTIFVISELDIDKKQVFIIGVTSFMIIPIILIAPFSIGPSFVGGGDCFPLKDYPGQIPADGTGAGFGGPRGLRKHAGIDLAFSGKDKNSPCYRGNIEANPYGYPECKVYAVKKGKVIKMDTKKFYYNTGLLLVDHGDYVINYGETLPLVKVGDEVSAGQHIATVLTNTNDNDLRAMLHFELYEPGVTNTIKWPAAEENPPKGLLNPRELLTNLKESVNCIYQE